MRVITINKTKFVPKSEADAEIAAAKKEKIKYVSNSKLPFKVGGKYFIRTVTYFAAGEVVDVHDGFLELKDAAWVADTGRFREAIMQGILNEVEPVDVPMYINVSSITDAFVWQHSLPLIQK